jgi:hypothetical protein
VVDDARGPDEKVQEKDPVVIGQLILWRFETRNWSLPKSPTIKVDKEILVRDGALERPEHGV